MSGEAADGSSRRTAQRGAAQAPGHLESRAWLLWECWHPAAALIQLLSHPPLQVTAAPFTLWLLTPLPHRASFPLTPSSSCSNYPSTPSKQHPYPSITTAAPQADELLHQFITAEIKSCFTIFPVFHSPS